MVKINLKPVLKSRLFWGIIVSLLMITSITFYVFKEKEKALRINTEEQLSKTIDEKRVVENRLEETIIAKKMLHEELTAEKEMTLALGKEVEEKERQLRLTSEKLEKETAARREAEDRLIITLKEKGILEAKVRKLSKVTKTVELEKIVVKTTPRLVGKVLVVNKEYSFVVVDLGRKNNLKLGNVLSVYREDEFIGRVQVEKLEERVCAASILSEWQTVEFKEDDDVREV